jgi:hypothetical protein
MAKGLHRGGLRLDWISIRNTEKGTLHNLVSPTSQMTEDTSAEARARTGLCRK